MQRTNRPSRREFLKRSTVTLAGGLSLVRAAHAAGPDQIKIALIGCGGRGTGAAANCLDVKDNIKLVAVADAFADRAKGARDHLKARYGEKVDVPEDRMFGDNYRFSLATTTSFGRTSLLP